MTRRRQVISYVLDYVLIIVLAGIFSALDRRDGYRQPFALTNIYIQYPYAVKERVTAGQAAVLAIIVPVVLMVIYALLIDGRVPGIRRQMSWAARGWELNCAILALALSIGSASVITNIFKNTVGRPRPDLLARCLPRNGAADPTYFGLVTSDICTQTDNDILKDGFRSFPSGHASGSFSGLALLALWLAAKLRVFDTRGEVWKLVIVVIPLMTASLIAITRIMDNRHHPFDVLFGSALGLLTAYVSFRQYFPPISQSTRAYSPREFANTQHGYAHDQGAEYDRASSIGGGSGRVHGASDLESGMMKTSHSQAQVQRQPVPATNTQQQQQAMAQEEVERPQSRVDHQSYLSTPIRKMPSQSTRPAEPSTGAGNGAGVGAGGGVAAPPIVAAAAATAAAAGQSRAGSKDSHLSNSQEIPLQVVHDRRTTVDDGDDSHSSGGYYTSASAYPHTNAQLHAQAYMQGNGHGHGHGQQAPGLQGLVNGYDSVSPRAPQLAPMSFTPRPDVSA